MYTCCWLFLSMWLAMPDHPGTATDRYCAAMAFIDTCAGTRAFYATDLPRVLGKESIQACYMVCDTTVPINPYMSRRTYMKLRYGAVPTDTAVLASLWRRIAAEEREWDKHWASTGIAPRVLSHGGEKCDAVLYFSEPCDDILAAELVPLTSRAYPFNYWVQGDFTTLLQFLFRFDDANHIVAFEYGIAIIN